ncbi:GntR family transcriptional regulator [Clostridia bacterium]|nr:GntR family transcriptional regulator [Clostridia bacterium]
MPKKRYFQVRKELVDIISRQKLAGNRLPPEADLAKRLGVSRGTIREVMQTLAREGIISKKHGLGNFVHKSAIETKMRIDTIQDFVKMIESGGYEARMEKIGSSKDVLIEDEFFEKASSNLNIENKEDLINLQSLYYADAKPAIFTQVYIPKDIILDDPDKEIKESLFKFLDAFCNQTIEQTIIKFEPRLASGIAAEMLEMKHNEPLIMWEEYYYNIYDEVVCVALAHFHPEFMKFTMLRKAETDASN